MPKDGKRPLQRQELRRRSPPQGVGRRLVRGIEGGPILDLLQRRSADDGQETIAKT
jgi:hypothetical protein